MSVSLDNNTIIYGSGWIDNNVSIPDIGYYPKGPFLGGKSNDKLFFIAHYPELQVNAFDITLNKWETNISCRGIPIDYHDNSISWVTDEQTSKSYLYDGSYYTNLVIFDSANLAWINSTSNPQNLIQNLFPKFITYSGFVQVLSGSDKIFYIGGTVDQLMPMNSILTYDIVLDSWLINNTTGKEIEGRTGHTAVMSSDKRIIVYGGINKDKLRPALPYLAVLDTSKIPYVWSTPTVENSIGSITEHSSIIIQNYMITTS
ncbi:15029_t:CDS:2, partial [Gigaspora margarita]